MKQSRSSRENIPQEHRSTVRANLRFDRREKSDMELFRYISDPDKRSRRIRELLILGMQTRATMQEISREKRATKTSDL